MNPADVLAMLQDFQADDLFGVSGTYARGETSVEDVGAVRGRSEVDLEGPDGVVVAAGTTYFRFVASDLTDGGVAMPPAAGDTYTVGSKVYDVIGPSTPIAEDTDAEQYDVFCRERG